jgi:ribosomal-protein-alanine N-acetyltransferase
MTEMRFQPMLPKDVDAVMIVELAAFSHPWTRGIFLDCIKPGYESWMLLGAALLEFIIDRARQRGAEVTFLEVRASNLTAARLYERFGFNEIGRRPNYYPAVTGKEDALVMAYSLVD